MGVLQRENPICKALGLFVFELAAATSVDPREATVFPFP